MILFSANTFANLEFNKLEEEMKNYPLQEGVQTYQSLELITEVQTRNFTYNDKLKLYKAIKILETVVNSPEFREEIYQHQYNGKTTFFENKGYSNEEIYQIFMSGAEVLNPVNDKVMNFDLTMYRSKNPFSKVKGYTKPDTNRIWIHSKFYRLESWTPTDVAANMVHEWVHKIGFGHSYYFDSNRPYSVPYAIGGIVSKVAKKLNLE